MATTSAKTAGAVAQTSSGAGSTSWTNVGGASLQASLSNDNGDTSYAGCASDFTGVGSNKSWDLNLTNFFTASDVPSGATVNGVTVSIKRRNQTDNAAYDVQDVDVQLIKGGTAQGDDKAAAGDWPEGSYTAQSYGGASDLWGLTLTQADVIASDFGVRIRITSDNNSFVDEVTHAEARITYVTITIDYTAGSGAGRGFMMFFP